MPPLRLTSLLHTALPDLSSTNRAVLSSLACRNGVAPPADEIAEWVGLRDRHQLARSLQRDGLPPLERLAGWARVLYWLIESESTRTSLHQLARRERIDPATAYRLVHRVTGLCWSRARRAGLSVALLRFREQCRARIIGARLPVATAVVRPAGDAPVATKPSLPAPPRLTPHHPAGILAGRLPVAGSPFDVTVGRDGSAYVTRTHAAALECLSLAPLRTVASVPTGAVPCSVALAPSGREAYVANQFTEDIAIVDLPARRRAATIPVPGHALRAVLSPDGRTLYVVTNLDRLCSVSLATRRVIANVPIPQAGYGIAVHPSGRWIYVSTWRGGSVIEIEAPSLMSRRQFAVGGITQESVVSSDGLLLYVANQAGWLDVIHLRTGHQVARVSFRTAAVSLALSPDDAVLYAGLLFGGRVAVVDRLTLRVLRFLEPGGRPRCIAFDPTGRLAVVANEHGWVDLVR